MTLRSSVREYLVSACKALELPEIPVEVTPAERSEFGDFSTNLALIGSKSVGLSPRELAKRIIEHIPDGPFSKIEIAGPGFINLFLKPEFIQVALSDILKAGENFGRADTGGGEPLQVEFVSSNPTGPLTVGHGRQAVLGDVLASLYESFGYRVTREYYFNDEGRQIDLLAESLWVRYRELFGEQHEIPEGGYHGDYLIEIARAVRDEIGDRFSEFDPQAREFFKTAAVSRIKESIREDLTRLGVEFDIWFSEGDLHRSGEVNATLDALRARGGVYEKDGAVWLKAEEHGGAKDSVLIRSDGRPTYLMVDIAYHMNKFRRGFAKVIDVQGSDHQVEQTCVKAALRILGVPEDFLSYAVHQFVSIREKGEKARMSTRAGRFVLLRELIDAVGRDVVRYFMAARKPQSHLEFDMDLARAQSFDNPAYYIQYAHTRIASIFRKAGIELAWGEVDLSPLTAPAELELIKLLDRFPEVIEQGAREFAPHLLTDYAFEVARAFHGYYDAYRVLGENDNVSHARLALLAATRTVIAGALGILGMSAPEVM